MTVAERHFSIREWSSLPIGSDGVTEAQADRLHQTAIAAAKRLGVPENGVLARGFRRLETKQVCGIISIPGCTVEILPKIDDDDGALRAVLARMLSVAFDIPVSEGEIAAIDSQDEDLLDAFINLFVTRLTEEIRAGLPRAYVSKEDVLPILRGSLDFRRQLIQRAFDPSRMYCRFDDFTEDTPLNRLFKTCLERISRFVRSEGLRRRVANLIERFSEIPESPDPTRERIAWDRINARFRPAYSLACMLLEAEWQNTTSGSSTGVALLFPMNVLYERYVARWLQRVLPHGGVSVQHRQYTLLKHGAFSVIPDIVIATPDGPLIIDTKWKNILGDLGDPLGVSSGDLYQLAAYGNVYQAKRVILLYPRTGTPMRPTIWQYTGTDIQVEIWQIDLQSQVRRENWEAFAREITSSIPPKEFDI